MWGCTLVPAPSSRGPWGHLSPRPPSVSPFVNECLRNRVVTRGREVIRGEHPAPDGKRDSQHVGDHGAQHVWGGCRRRRGWGPGCQRRRGWALSLSVKHRRVCVCHSPCAGLPHTESDSPGEPGRVSGNRGTCWNGRGAWRCAAASRAGKELDPGWGRGRGRVTERARGRRAAPESAPGGERASANGACAGQTAPRMPASHPGPVTA